MTTRSVVLAAGFVVGRPTGVIYTVPLQWVAIAKSVYLQASTGGAGYTISLSVYRASVQHLVYIWPNVVANTPLEWNGWVVLEGTDQLVLVYTAGQVSYWVSGALLPAGPRP